MHCSVHCISYSISHGTDYKIGLRLSVCQVEEHDGDVIFNSGSGHMAVLCMQNASGHNYRNSSVIVDLVMGQIPRSTERIFSLLCDEILLAVREWEREGMGIINENGKE